MGKLFTVVRRSEQTVDHFLIGMRRPIFYKRLYFGGRRRQTR